MDVFPDTLTYFMTFSCHEIFIFSAFLMRRLTSTLYQMTCPRPLRAMTDEIPGAISLALNRFALDFKKVRLFKFYVTCLMVWEEMAENFLGIRRAYTRDH